jgi:hypothetical protein
MISPLFTSYPFDEYFGNLTLELFDLFGNPIGNPIEFFCQPVGWRAEFHFGAALGRPRYRSACRT